MVQETETRTARTARGSGRVRTRLVITLIGIAALVVGAFLDWQSTQPGYRLTNRSLLHNDLATTANTTRSVGAICIVIAAVALLGLLDRTGWLSRLAGLAAVVLFAMFALQLYRHDGQHFTPALHAVHAGAWVTVGAGVVLLLGGLVRYRPKRRRLAREQDSATVERERVTAVTAVRPTSNEPIHEADHAPERDEALAADHEVEPDRGNVDGSDLDRSDLDRAAERDRESEKADI
ncbi:MAG TPA: hypothetical protein VH372_22590 [Actinospica sp.]|jgi:hypothetical protein|nr:hypothetical protein [Actinospica sp.]